ncbi:MAG: hypothetical protein ACI8UO_000821 [Verrucomicrobiales bacterium]|jgi:hypothetical protein
MRGLDPTLKAARLANYVVTLRHELIRLSNSCGVEHPVSVTTNDFEILDGQLGSSTIRDIFSYDGHPAVPRAGDIAAVSKLMPTGRIRIR